ARESVPVKSKTPEQLNPGDTRSIAWRPCLIGWVVGEVLLLVLSNLGLRGADLAFGSSDRIDGGIVGVATLLSVMAGGFLAARMAGRFGLYQGIVVAIGFILVGAIFQFLQEASLVDLSLKNSSHTLINLGPMNLGDLMSNDLLALFAGSVGGI